LLSWTTAESKPEIGAGEKLFPGLARRRCAINFALPLMEAARFINGRITIWHQQQITI
jgi:hypothetical protein